MSHSVNTSGCSYTTLQNYNGYNNNTETKYSNAENKKVIPVLPVYGSPGYDVLNGGFEGKTENGYFNVNKAYGKDDGSCGQCKM